MYASHLHGQHACHTVVFLTTIDKLLRPHCVFDIMSRLGGHYLYAGPGWGRVVQAAGLQGRQPSSGQGHTSPERLRGNSTVRPEVC